MMEGHSPIDSRKGPLTNAMILLRTQAIDRDMAEFAQCLGAWAGAPVVLIMDERNGPVDCGALPKISLTRKACENIGLYCPDDFAWRCGDYGFYLARHAFGEVQQFWMIESDVRIGGSDPASFFRFFADKPHDFLASYIAVTSSDWYWHRSATSRDHDVLKCFFPVCRLNRTAIDKLFAARLRHGQQWSRRHFWANDEAFVATGVAASGLTFADLNSLGRKTYDTSEYSFETLRDANEPLPDRSGAALFHPVLAGENLAQKRARLSLRAQPKSRWQRMKIMLDQKIGLSALSAGINAVSPW
ncbi:hypothetical protein NVSP9465_00468 [Novosphingobium sp. CECT 9465]|nr:hypothetical protein NVSP9465_00468 [Novosphingobium sp. CECT 9465]